MSPWTWLSGGGDIRQRSARSRAQRPPPMAVAEGILNRIGGVIVLIYRATVGNLYRIEFVPHQRRAGVLAIDTKILGGIGHRLGDIDAASRWCRREDHAVDLGPRPPHIGITCPESQVSVGVTVSIGRAVSRRMPISVVSTLPLFPT